MADNKIEKGTIYQNINKLMNLDGLGFQKDPELQEKQAKIIIRGNSPEEIYQKGLELEQKKELQKKFFRTTDRGFQKALQYEAARLPAYIDYEGMEYYPIISSALDLFMEETTTIGFNGKMLNIYSNKERVKFLLEDFFYNVINVNVNLPFWTRNLPIKHDSIIPLLNGEEITIKEIAERLKLNPDKDIWTYAIQDVTKRVVTGKIVWCDLTRKDSDILRINLDDNTYVETAPDHEFLMRNGTYKRADELQPQDSLMPFYTKPSEKKIGDLTGYEKTYNPQSDYYKYTHRFVAEDCIVNINEEQTSGDRYCTHHINFNRLDNSPENLKRMTLSGHFKFHYEHANVILQRPDVVEKRMAGIDMYLRSDKRRKRMSKEMMGIYPDYFNQYNNSELHDKHNVIRSNEMLNHWVDDEYRKMVKDKMTLKFDEKCFNHIKEVLENLNRFVGAKQLSEKLKTDEIFIKLFKKANPNIRKNLLISINSRTISAIIDRTYNQKYYEFVSNVLPNLENDIHYNMAVNISKAHEKRKSVIVNHKVLSIERLTQKHDVYCMEVVGPNGEQDRHNFPICSKNVDNQHTRNGVFVSNCKYGDNFVLLYGEKGKGLTHAKQMVNYEIERFERVSNGKPLVKFKERMTGDEFNTFEVAHFRLLGDDRFIPYGSSVLNKIRRVWRQLVMAEDAMLTYRIIRAGEKKVFKIDVGNIDEDDIEDYIFKVATKFKKTSQVNPNDGQMDYRFNILGNDEDYFLPVRNANTQTGIETLPGASNLSDIADIEYLRENLFSGLGIPKPFLSFQDAAGGGKNMAQYDIRFAKKINRIQQGIIQELNKMAMIHLYLLGYSSDDINNFTLTLNNPSTQLDLQKAELLREKAQTYTELTRAESGIAAMSHTEAQRMLFNKSEGEIVESLKQQKMEKVIMQELADSPVTIKKTGLFADIDKRYGETSGEVAPTSGGTTGGMPPAGGEGGMPPISGGDMGGGTPPPPVPGLPNQSPSDLPPITAEGYKSDKKALSDEEYEDHVENLVYGKKNKKPIKKDKLLITESDKINEDLNTKADLMVEDIDKLILRSKEIENEYIINESGVDFNDIDSMDLGENVLKN